MKKIKALYILVLAILCTFPISAQEDSDNGERYEVSGTIVNKSGDKLSGLVIIASESKNRTYTDDNGFFKLKTSLNDILVVQGLGIEKSQIFVNSGEIENETIVINEWGVIEGKEEIHIAHGKIDFERITGSVERITGDELSDYPTVFVQEALAGRLSGVASTFGNTSPEIESFGNTIRGAGTGETYVDGIQNSLVLTPGEVDDVIIAKDFGSSFFYGGFATQGAMIVNSKKGVVGDRSMKFKVRSGLRTPTFTPSTLSAKEYIDIYDKALVSDGLSTIYNVDIDGDGDFTNDADAEAAYASASRDTVRYPNRRFHDELVDNMGSYSLITADFSGGNEKAQYFSHLGYYTTDGVESVGAGRSNSRLRLNNNLQMQLNDLLSIDIGIGGTLSKVEAPEQSGNDIFSNIFNYPANAYPYKINDTIYTSSPNFGRNLLVDLAHSNTIEINSRDAFARLALNFDLSTIVKGLSFNALIGTVNTSTISTRFSISPPTARLADNAVGYSAYNPGNPVSSAGRSGATVSRNQSLNLNLKYEREFSENHKLRTDFIYYTKEVTASGFTQDRLNRNLGLRANYFINNKYVLEGNLMNVAVRQLSSDERKKLTYSAGLGWLIHKEPFMEDAKWLNFLKLRGNFGVQANINSIFDRFFFDIDGFNTSGAGGFGTISRQSSSGGYVRVTTGTDAVRVPKTEYLSVGADFQMFNSRLNGQINYFKIRDYDQLVLAGNLQQFALLPSNYAPLFNFNDAERRGFDASISYSQKIGQVSFTLGVNGMYNERFNNKINEIVYSEPSRNQTGNFGDVIRGYEADGIYQTQAEVDAALPSSLGEVTLGDIRYKDSNGDGILDQNDERIIGHSNRIFYGINYRMKYKNFSLSIHGDGAAGGKYIESLHWNRGNRDYAQGIQASWPVSNDLPRLTTLSNPNNYRNSTFWLKSASYFNLRSINFAYEVPQSFLDDTAFERLTLFAAGKNIQSFSSVKNRYMPNRSAGYSIYPVLASFELGLEISF